jgi:O-acetylserine/cysteine efflux transporter
LLVAINAMWGASYDVAKSALAEVPPFTLALARFALAFAFLAPFAWPTVRRLRWSAEDHRELFLLGLAGFGFCFALAYVGQRIAPATDVALIVVAEPLIIIAWAKLLTAKPAPPRVIPAAIVAFGGVALIAFSGRSTSLPMSAHVMGDALVIAGTAVQGWYTVHGEAVARRMPAIALTWATIGYGALALAPPAAGELLSGRLVTVSTHAVLAALYLSIGCTALGYLIWFVLLRRAESRLLGMSLYLQPLVGVAAASIFLGEPVTWRTLVGGMLVLGAVAAVSASPGSMETDAVEPETESFGVHL